MGVSAVGKTSVGLDLAALLGAQFIDADDLHSPEAIAKMSAGTPLVDEDRWPWLDRVGQILAERDRPTVMACSALRAAYRDRIRLHCPDAFFAHLVADPTRLIEQSAKRRGHFMPPSLLRSQLATLEPLTSGEVGAAIQVDAPAGILAERIAALLGTNKHR